MKSSILFVLFIVAANLVYAKEKNENGSNPYVDCYAKSKNQNKCLDLVGRDLWIPVKKSDCIMITDILSEVYKQKMKFSYKLLYFNEKCRKYSKKYFDRTTYQKPKQVKKYRTLTKSEFSIQVPSTWKEIKADHPSTKLKVYDTNGTSDCNIVITRNTAFNNINPRKFAEYSLSKNNKIPNTKRISHNIGLLGSFPAYISHDLRKVNILGISLPYYVLQYSTVNSGRLFALTCRTPQSDIDSSIKTFKVIAQSFKIN